MKEVGADVRESFTKPFTRIIGNGYELLTESDLRFMESNIDLIIPGDWWLQDHQLIYPNTGQIEISITQMCDQMLGNNGRAMRVRN